MNSISDHIGYILFGSIPPFKKQESVKYKIKYEAKIFFSSLIMSVHHFGIEKNLWNALSSCEANNKILTNSTDLKEYLLNKNYVSCKDVSFKFLGISLAGYNIIISFVLFTLSIIGFRKLKN